VPFAGWRSTRLRHRWRQRVANNGALNIHERARAREREASHEHYGNEPRLFAGSASEDGNDANLNGGCWDERRMGREEENLRERAEEREICLCSKKKDVRSTHNKWQLAQWLYTFSLLPSRKFACSSKASARNVMLPLEEKEVSFCFSTPPSSRLNPLSLSLSLSLRRCGLISLCLACTELTSHVRKPS
jgi:hypothetical protein